jgi:F0F1-type ATP synthase assembly protein I
MSPDPSGEQPGRSRYAYRSMGRAYQGALEAVFAIVVATGAGYWADGAFGSSPWGVLAGATIGFAAFVLRLYRLGMSLNRASAQPESPENAIQPEESCERPARHPARAGHSGQSGDGGDGGDRNGSQGNGAK